MLFDLTNCDRLMLNKGKYPIMFIGSCTVGPIDRSSNTLSNKMLVNPNGGAIGIIASGREVYQTQNQLLGQRLAEQMLIAENGTWEGQLFANAQQSCVNITNATRDNIINHLTYNYLGDPALPHRAITHSVALDAPESITILAGNTITGSVLDNEGEVDTEFNGMVRLTIYDVPEVKKNLIGSSAQNSYAEVELDQEVIGEAIAGVTNGTFTVSFAGPATVKQGGHRIQAYVYSNDGSKRGLGHIAAVPFVEADGDAEAPESKPASIRSFEYSDGALTAEIHIPNGLAQSSAAKSSILLVVDGQTIPRVQNFAHYESGDVIKVNYALTNMSHGRHSASISVLDARDEWTDAKCEFSVFDIPQSNLSASVGDDAVDFEVSSAIGSDVAMRLIVERLNGDIAYSADMKSSSESVALPAGAYRAYVQLKARNSASSTPKIEVFVD